MKLWAIFLFCLLQSLVSVGQTLDKNNASQPTGDKLNLVSSLSGRINAKTGHMVFYRPVYEHKGNTLSADSGYIYEDEIKRQFFEAFGNVVITQPSGTVIYSDRLHYDATPQQARLTGNVKMIDDRSTLTTNYLTYNMRSKVGTYTGGGRIVSQGDTITSKNAYYFESTADAYFRHKVVVRSENVKVFTDSMRYNSISRETYFFGPTNIKGNKGENLYTERGTYNTGTGIANFNKNNLYTEGTKFLKGDSLHYNREKGFGEAFRNVVFVDTLDKFYAYGGRGLYKQDEESILMTEKPLIITVVKNDSTDNSVKDSTALHTDTKKTTKELKKQQKEAEKKVEDKITEDKSVKDILPKSGKDSLDTPPAPKVDSVFMTADTLFSKVILVKDYKPLQLNLRRDGGQLIADDEKDYGDDEGGDAIKATTAQDSTQLDSILTIAKPETSLEHIKKTVQPKNIEVKPNTEKTKATANTRPIKKIAEPLAGIDQTLKADSTLRQNVIIPKENTANTIMEEALKVAQTPDSTKTVQTSTVIDSTKAVADTAKTRIVKAFYNVRLFKSDLQAVADSAYYGMVDSMFRFMGRPMIWAQGSQISADTIFMQMVNQQLDNTLLQNNAFMVNAVLDTIKFNQLKGRKITAFFTNNNIDKLYVDGNAENITFSADEKTKIIKEMVHDRGARIKIKMENKELIDYITVRKVDQKVYPFKMVTQENEILKGFVWRPQDRPTSKEDLLNRKREVPKETISGNSSDSTRNTTGSESESSVPKDNNKSSQQIEKKIADPKNSAMPPQAIINKESIPKKKEEELEQGTTPKP